MVSLRFTRDNMMHVTKYNTTGVRLQLQPRVSAYFSAALLGQTQFEAGAPCGGLCA